MLTTVAITEMPVATREKISAVRSTGLQHRCCGSDGDGAHLALGGPSGPPPYWVAGPLVAQA
jgi:hypothetical protein